MTCLITLRNSQGTPQVARAPHKHQYMIISSHTNHNNSHNNNSNNNRSSRNNDSKKQLQASGGKGENLSFGVPN